MGNNVGVGTIGGKYVVYNRACLGRMVWLGLFFDRNAIDTYEFL